MKSIVKISIKSEKSEKKMGNSVFQASSINWNSGGIKDHFFFFTRLFS